MDKQNNFVCVNEDYYEDRTRCIKICTAFPRLCEGDCRYYMDCLYCEHINDKSDNAYCNNCINHEQHDKLYACERKN